MFDDDDFGPGSGLDGGGSPSPRGRGGDGLGFEDEPMRGRGFDSRGGGFGGAPGGFGGGAPSGGFGGGGGGQSDALRVVGGVNPPTRRPDLIAAIRHWHRGMRNRTTGELEPWKTVVLTHLETGRPVGQWDLRSDEDDDDLSAEIEMRMESHGRPLARNTGTGQTYQLDAYFGNMTMPQANWTGDVRAEASLDAFGSPFLRARGTPQDFEQQRYRHQELQTQASFGLTRFNVELLVDQIKDLRGEVAYYRGQLHTIEERERALADKENERRMDAARKAANDRRIDFLIAKASRYIPIFAAKLDQRLFGLGNLTGEEKEGRASEIVRMLLSKMNDSTGGGQEKMAQVMAMLDLSEKEQEKIQEVGIMFWLEEQRRQLQKEAEMTAATGGFMGLGEEVAALAPPKND